MDLTGDVDPTGVMDAPGAMDLISAMVLTGVVGLARVVAAVPLERSNGIATAMDAVHRAMALMLVMALSLQL